MYIDKIASEVLEDDYFVELYQKVCSNFVCITFRFKKDDLTLKELKDILRFADILSNSEIVQAKNKAYRIVSLIRDQYKDNQIYKIYSSAILKRLSNFPNLSKEEEIPLPYDREIDYEINKINLEIPIGDGHFTPIQHKIFNLMKTNNFFSFSGPTSMGKSFLIRQFILDKIKSNRYLKGFSIIVPSKALIKQYTIDINNALKENDIQDFNLLTTPNILDFMSFENEKFIFILTPERLLNLLACKNEFYLDYLIVDEAHKVFENSDRGLTYYTSIDSCITKFPAVKVIISSPLIQNPDIYANLYLKNDVATYKTLESPVTQNLFLIDCIDKRVEFFDDKKYEYNVKNINYLNNKNSIFYKLGKGSSLIYINSNDKIIEFSKEFCEYLKENNIKLTNKDEDIKLEQLRKVIKKNIHSSYYLVDCIEYGVAFHYGKIPSIIKDQIEKLFKDGVIKYLFCTNTLLEGVNMPTKNIFILSNKIGRSDISSIDFWNLAGRAGRLGCEFYGNVFCIRMDENTWENKGIFFDKENIKVDNTIENRITTSKRTIKKILTNNEINPTLDKSKRYLSYAANIIQIDSLSGNDTSIYKKFKDIDSETIKKCKEFENRINKEVLKSSKSIDIKVQNNVLDNISIERMPKDVNMKNCIELLNEMYGLYRWDIKENKLKKEGQLKYLALLMTKWINDEPLNRIISNSIEYHDIYEKDLYYRGRYEDKFDVSNQRHINLLINQIIDDIEQILRFDLEKYFNHYYLILKSKFGEENIGYNWASYLEFGTRSNKNIVLQNIGFSRYSANLLLKNYKDYLVFDGERLISIKKGILNTDLKNNYILIHELNNYMD